MSKRLIALLSSIAVLTACAGSLTTANAESYVNPMTGETVEIEPTKPYAVTSDGIAYSTLVSSEDFTTYVDDWGVDLWLPNPGELTYSSLIKLILKNEDSSVKLPVKFRIIPNADGSVYLEEKEQFMNTEMIDGQTYAEAKEEINALIEEKAQSGEELSALREEDLPIIEKIQKINADVEAYLSSVAAEEIRLEPERLTENGVEIANIMNDYYYTVLTVEQLQNFPVNSNFGYEVILTTMPGDVQENGKIDIIDVISVNKAILGKETFTDEQTNSADINQNGKPDADDALAIMKRVVGLIDSFA